MNFYCKIQLRFYWKGIYFRTVTTLFGERGINKESLIADKYLLLDKGYETGFALIHNIGLATQMPKERVIASHTHNLKLQYEKLLFLADRYYNKNTVIQLAHTAGEGGYAL